MDVTMANGIENLRFSRSVDFRSNPILRGFSDPLLPVWFKRSAQPQNPLPPKGGLIPYFIVSYVYDLRFFS
jgi:hypothetical protein